jgi:hypothetical protein
MSKVLRVASSDYKIQVKEGGNIVLDTTDNILNQSGTVLITGNLQVNGTTTTVNSEVLEVTDNIITLCKDNTAVGVPVAFDFRSGIEVERGTLANSNLVYDERINWQIGSVSGQGTWVIEQGTTVIPLKTSGLVNDSSLYLQPGPGAITVTNTANYEQRIWNYVSGVITDAGAGIIIDDDNIPNTKAVTDYVDYFFANVFQHKILQEDTYVEAMDFDTHSTESNVEVGVDGIVSAKFYTNRAEISNIKIQDNEISTTESNADLLIAAPGTGVVKIKDVLELTGTPNEDDPTLDPDFPLDGVRLYSKTETVGGTGVYFKNKLERADEIISTNRSLVFSMLF